MTLQVKTTQLPPLMHLLKMWIALSKRCEHHSLVFWGILSTYWFVSKGNSRENHLGILDLVNAQGHYGDISSLIWIGEQGNVITPTFSQGLIPKIYIHNNHYEPNWWSLCSANICHHLCNQFVFLFFWDEDIVPTPPPPIIIGRLNNEKPPLGKKFDEESK